MARWEVYVRGDGQLGMNYRNLVTGVVHHAGVLRADTPMAMVVSWIVKDAGAAPYDVISLPDACLWVLPEVREVAPVKGARLGALGWRGRC